MRQFQPDAELHNEAASERNALRYRGVGKTHDTYSGTWSPGFGLRMKVDSIGGDRHNSHPPAAKPNYAFS